MELVFDAGNDSHDVGARFDFRCHPLAKRGVSQIRVGRDAGEGRKSVIVGHSDAVAGNVCPAVTPASLKQIINATPRLYEGVKDLLVGAWREDSWSLFPLLVVLERLKVPVHLVHLVGRLGHHAVLHGQVLHDRHLLVPLGAIVLHKGGQRAARRRQLSGLLFLLPLLGRQAHVFKRDALVDQKVADRLGAALQIKVD